MYIYYIDSFYSKVSILFYEKIYKDLGNFSKSRNNSYEVKINT